MKKKRLFLGVFFGVAVLLLVGGLLFKYSESKRPVLYENNGIRYVSQVEGKDFLIYKEGKWEKTFLKGVNIGAAKPGTFPGELAITKEEYLRWFQYISDMNAEVIRVYTTLKPAFYDALYEYNREVEKPLYLMQGVWVNEEDIARLNDPYAEQGRIRNNFIGDATDLVDILHGNANLPEKRGFASGEYKSDVSPYVIGWILGIEWDAYFVQETNEKNKGKESYEGEFLYTEEASPFEAFLCEVGDTVLGYEMEKYQMTRALSFTNWLTTDPLDHTNEPYESEDMSIVNVEHIKAKESYECGMFASYHIYPYYPDFLSYQNDYVAFRDENGEINTYQAYLRDLMEEHSMPVLVAEFGVPASRGKAHDSLYSGYDQGSHSEKEQGEIISSLLGDIALEGYCGALVFAWQDEWFKRTWNTVDFDLPDTRPFWSNPQTNEQEFGLMAFDPGEEKSIVDVDGDIGEWEKAEPLLTKGKDSLYVNSDEKYLYLMLRAPDYDFGKDTLFIPVDSIGEQGNTRDNETNLTFEKPADFLIRIGGVGTSKILVDAYYDSFYLLYGEKLRMIDEHPDYRIKGNGGFNPMFLCLSREIYLKEDNRTIPFSSYETGKLTLGDANPDHEGFDSLTDYAVKDGNVEIRIPWQLLNVMDPSTKSVMQDLYKGNSIEKEIIDGMSFGFALLKDKEKAGEPLKMNFYSWKTWTVPTYHERLKPSYYILQEAFKGIR